MNNYIHQQEKEKRRNNEVKVQRVIQKERKDENKQKYIKMECN